MRAVSRPTSLRRIRLLVQSRCCVSHLRPFDPQSSRRAASHPLTAPVGSPKQALRRSRLRPCRLRRRADPSGPAAPRARAGPKPAPAASPTHAVLLRACRSPPRQRARRQPPRCPPPQPAARGSAGAASHAPSSRSAPESSCRAIVPPLAAPAGKPKQALRRRSQLRPCRLRRRAALSGPAAPRACAGLSRHPLRRPRMPSSSTRAAPQHASVRAVSRPAALRRNRLLVAVPVLRPTRVPGRSAPESSCRAAVRPLATPTGKPKQTLRRSRLRPCRLRRRADLSSPAVPRPAPVQAGTSCAAHARRPPPRVPLPATQRARRQPPRCPSPQPAARAVTVLHLTSPAVLPAAL